MLSSHPFHEKYGTVTCILSSVWIRLVTVGESFTVKEDNL